MSYCPELFHKFKEYSEACGLGDPNDFQRHINICAEISDRFKVEVDKVYLLFSKTASKPVTKLGKQNPVREKILKNIEGFLNDNKRITKKQIEFWLYENGEGELKTSSIPPNKKAKKVMLDPKPILANGDLTSKLQALKSILTAGQLSILHDVMAEQDKDDELAALSLVLIWAKEHLDHKVGA